MSVPGSPAAKSAEEAERPLLRAEAVTKSFAGVPALKNGQIVVHAGSVHALCGGNGAGKSTFLNIVMGILLRDSGVIELNGNSVHFTSPRQALHNGIAMISQELSPVREMSVAENLFLGALPRQGLAFVDFPKLNGQAEELLGQLHFSIDPRARLGSLALSQIQLVEIAKAFTRNAQVIIMDEPTSALGERETETLFAAIRRVTGLGKAVIYVSHRLTEIFSIADRYTVFRDGSFVETGNVSEIDRRHLIGRIIGRAVNEQFPKRLPSQGKLLLEVKNLRSTGRLKDIQFDLHEGEIIGLYGLLGSGRSETLGALFGSDPLAKSEIKLAGRPVAIRSPKDAVRQGIALVTEDRKETGLVLTCSVRDNISLSSLPKFSRLGLIDHVQEQKSTRAAMQRLNVRAASPSIEVQHLSGGNQQKVVLARWLQIEPRILLLDEPTRGVDAGAKQEIYEFMADFARRGGGIVLVSSEIEEILGLSHRIIVLKRGAIAGEFANDGVTQSDLVHLASE